MLSQHPLPWSKKYLAFAADCLENQTLQFYQHQEPSPCRGETSVGVLTYWAALIFFYILFLVIFTSSWKNVNVSTHEEVEFRFVPVTVFQWRHHDATWQSLAHFIQLHKTEREHNVEFFFFFIKSLWRNTDSPGAVHDTVQAVGDGEDGAVRELFADRILNQIVCLQVYSCRGLVQDQDAWFSQQCSSQTQQLPLPNAVGQHWLLLKTYLKQTKKKSTWGHSIRQLNLPTWGSLPPLQLHVVILPAALLRRSSDVTARVLSKSPHHWICQTGPSSSSASQRTELDPAHTMLDKLGTTWKWVFVVLFAVCAYLRYDRDPVSQIMQPNWGDVYTVDEYTPFSCFNDSKQTVGQAWFPSSSATYNTNLKAARENTENVKYKGWIKAFINHLFVNVHRWHALKCFKKYSHLKLLYQFTTLKFWKLFHLMQLHLCWSVSQEL